MRPPPPPQSQAPPVRVSRARPPNYELQHTLRGHTMSISAVKFSPDGKLLASCGAEKVIKIWNPENGDFIRDLSGHTQGLSDIAWSSDSTFLASASDDTTIRIWNIELGLTQKILKGHTKWVFCLNYNTTSNLLVSGGCEGDVRVWNVARGKSSFPVLLTLAHDSPGKCMKTLHAHLDYVTAVHFNRDATLIVSCALDGLMYASPSPQPDITTYLFLLPLQVGYGTPLTANASKLSQKVTTPSGKPLFILKSQQSQFSSPTPPKPPHCSQQVQFSPNSKYILSTAHDSAIRLWDYQTTRCLKTYVGHVNNKYCISACFSVTGGKWIVAGSEDHKTYIWDLQTREIMQVLGGHTDVVVAVATHPSENMIATGSIDSDLAIRLWYDRGGPIPNQ
ncbi:WD repeat-containing protein 5 [Leucoagaricus sp. SymC.cos]|nr:WD repeat-containing protein 5 [Leucoagaricus sp. SymC.cos]